MVETIITIENLSKRYLIGHQSTQREKYTALRDVIVREAHNFARKTVDALRGRQIIQGDEVEEFWALRNVSFEVEEGEVIGIIGRNGAGKSTLLKILSRITEPTQGRVLLRGRVASLLEVGTGFHQELTGRENIFLNGAILGMRQREIRKKLDEIVAFAEVENFLDTPVKHYSSGMYVRLAFAVAAHLEPEILIVDEVLAVGDTEFQKKCLGKMDEVSRQEGRTVLFVSHNLAAIAELASRGIVLDSGSIVENAPATKAIATYLSQGSNQGVYVYPPNRRSAVPHVSRVEIITSDPNGIQRFGMPLEIRFTIKYQKPISKGCFWFHIIDQFQRPVIHAFAYYPKYLFDNTSGETVLICRFPTLQLNVGHYHIRTHLGEAPGGEHYETVDGICPFEIVRTDQSIFWGWRPGECVYHEHWEFSIN